HILEDLYDPEAYQLQITINPRRGMLSLLEEVYEPAPDKKRAVIQYVYNPDAPGKTQGAGIITDSFDYQIRDKKTRAIIGSSTATIFIPLCGQAEDEPPPRTKVEVKLVYKDTGLPFEEGATIRLAGPENR